MGNNGYYNQLKECNKRKFLQEEKFGYFLFLFISKKGKSLFIYFFTRGGDICRWNECYNIICLRKQFYNSNKTK